jgi:hypothetical protein
MTSQERLVQGLRDLALNATHIVELILDNPQAWPAILTYAETIEADDPERAAELRHLVTCYQSGVKPVHRFYFTAEQDAQKMVDGALARLRGDPPPAS